MDMFQTPRRPSISADPPEVQDARVREQLRVQELVETVFNPTRAMDDRKNAARHLADYPFSYYVFIKLTTFCSSKGYSLSEVPRTGHLSVVFDPPKANLNSNDGSPDLATKRFSAVPPELVERMEVVSKRISQLRQSFLARMEDSANHLSQIDMRLFLEDQQLGRSTQERRAQQLEEHAVFLATKPEAEQSRRSFNVQLGDLAGARAALQAADENLGKRIKRLLSVLLTNKKTPP